METWPVAPQCQKLFAELLPTHDICPLPAFDRCGNLIPPLKYETKLRGAIVEAHFAFVHHYIKKHKHHIFLPIIHRFNVLKGPPALPTSPFKHIRIGASKGKQRAY
ncbi:hypothetical protein JVT61DRAFT_3756 [Boletus reticuloceps]|uniref:Uncharacterized protein n=1 Tax=Boletus reticuloceps TaxID=495285 RepID=A0A8I2YMZ1_9AGAM|nr:hypothetical protein JVT61DRAFT_3756 [Boletus reticuloceps]